MHSLLYIYMKNYHFPTCYTYSVKKELNLKRALDEDTGVFSFFFSFLLHWVTVILGVFVFFIILIFCESLYIYIYSISYTIRYIIYMQYYSIYSFPINATYVAICSPPCVRGDCISNNMCQCNIGFTGVLCQREGM